MLGAYHLQIKFGDSLVPITTTNLKELTIIQDLNKFLPTFRLRVNDTSGVLTHIMPFDKNMGNVQIELALNATSADRNSFNFLVYIRQPEGDQHTPSSLYDITGALDIPLLFNPSYSRGFSGSIKENLENLALDSFLVDKTEVSSSLDYNLNLIQPTWTNAQFLNYLKKHIVGKNGEYGYKCNIFVKDYNKVFQLKSLNELINIPISYKFVLNDEAYHDRLPIFNYYIFDNYKMYETFGARKQKYSYFDYENSEFVKSEESINDYLSLTDYFLVDGGDSLDSNEINNTGHTNDFEQVFKGRVKGDYSNRLNSLVKMWITTQGLPNIVPGQTIEIFFPHGAVGNNLYSFQYSGYWLVEQVIHMCGDAFYTKLLLTRNGLDTDRATTLLKASNKKLN